MTSFSLSPDAQHPAHVAAGDPGCPLIVILPRADGLSPGARSAVTNSQLIAVRQQENINIGQWSQHHDISQITIYTCGL